MKVNPTKLKEVLFIEPNTYNDPRGFFLETYHEKRYQQQGIPFSFVQDNFSQSNQGVVRGLHYQHPQNQGKLVYVTYGEVFDVAVDIRRGSPTFGQHVSFILSAEHHHQIYIPPGFAHGFCVLSDKAHFVYKCTAYYAPQHERGILWNDPQLGIEWPLLKDFCLSDKDKTYPCLSDIPSEALPTYEENQ